MAEEKIDYTRHYRKWHSDSVEYTNQISGYYKSNFIPHLDIEEGHKILDIGCGMGLFLQAMRDFGFLNIEGIDIDEGQVEACKKKNLKVSLVKDSLQYLSEKVNHFDRITLFDVLEHIPQNGHLAFLKAIFKSLKPDGKLVLTVPNANSVLATRWRYIDWTHHISFTETSLDFVLYNSGFQQIEIKETEFFSKPSPRLFFTRYILKKDYRKRLKHWLLFKFFRKVQRLKYIAELGQEQGAAIPLSLNLLAIAAK